MSELIAMLACVLLTKYLGWIGCLLGFIVGPTLWIFCMYLGAKWDGSWEEEKNRKKRRERRVTD